MDARVASFNVLNYYHITCRLPSSLLARHLDSFTNPDHELSPATGAALHMDTDPKHSDEKPDDIPHCCCGKPDCTFRTHSCKLLQKVKRDARIAGELGQVCYSGLVTLSTSIRLAVELKPPTIFFVKAAIYMSIWLL